MKSKNDFLENEEIPPPSCIQKGGSYIIPPIECPILNLSIRALAH